MWKANVKTTTLQLLDSLSPKNMRDASSGDKLKIALFGDLSLEEAMDLSRDRQILELVVEKPTPESLACRLPAGQVHCCTTLPAVSG
jgi:hypothetical protein